MGLPYIHRYRHYTHQRKEKYQNEYPWEIICKWQYSAWRHRSPPCVARQLIDYNAENQFCLSLLMGKNRLLPIISAYNSFRMISRVDPWMFITFLSNTDKYVNIVRHNHDLCVSVFQRFSICSSLNSISIRKPKIHHHNVYTCRNQRSSPYMMERRAGCKYRAH